MPKTKYADLYGVTQLQNRIMRYIDWWVRNEKTPIAQKEIVDQMNKLYKTKDFTTVKAIDSLLRKGYLRRAIVTSNKTYYVQLRRVSTGL